MPDQHTRAATAVQQHDADLSACTSDGAVRWDLLRKFFREFAVEAGGDSEALEVVDAVMRGAEMGKRAAVLVRDDLPVPANVLGWEREVLWPVVPGILGSIAEERDAGVDHEA
jgi:hypothetical protein